MSAYVDLRREKVALLETTSTSITRLKPCYLRTDVRP